MYKIIFNRQNSSGVYQQVEETNENFDNLLTTVFTNVEGIDKWHFLEDLCATLYKQVDGEYQLLTSGTEFDAYRNKWETEYNS